MPKRLPVALHDQVHDVLAELSSLTGISMSSYISEVMLSQLPRMKSSLEHYKSLLDPAKPDLQRFKLTRRPFIRP